MSYERNIMMNVNKDIVSIAYQTFLATTKALTPSFGPKGGF